MEHGYLGCRILEDAISQSNSEYVCRVCALVCLKQRFLKSRTVPFQPSLITLGPHME